MFEKIALIGLGLMGSSLCRVIRREGLADVISGNARSAETRARALELGLADEVFEEPERAAEGADLVILCVPVGVVGSVTKAIAGRLKTGAILTDVGSVKGAVVRDVAPHLPEGVHFVPGHPVAGTEHSGPESGFAELFENRWCILTPLPDGDEDAVRKIEEFWRACGSEVERMDVEHHDLVLAITSHVPHLIAYNIVMTAKSLEDVTDSEIIKFSAAGFRDFTRIAASDPTMWRDVFLNNREAVLEILGRFSEDLAALQRAVRWGDGDMLFDLFMRSRAVRRGVVEAGQDTDEADFGRRS